MEVDKEKIRYILQHIFVIENVDKITEIIEVDRHVSSRSIAQEVKINHKTALTHLNNVGFKKKLDVWVPHQLTPKNMMDRISICEALTKRNEIDPFLKQMMTGDEKWDTHKTILCEIDRGQSALKQLKRQTLNSDLYCEQLDHLKLATDQKRPELVNRRGAVFHQDNVRPQTSVVTRQKLWELGWEVLMHPQYSPDLSPNDYHLFLILQNLLSDKKLGSREDCENELLEFFSKKGQDFYERGNMKLPLKWQQIIQQNGTYLAQIGQSETC
ncbi:histone-lysine N-methyltransferase SETMAR [Trichonephila clavipes]|nr:histone-lysine N-methyltransferase SETMAR [Trichonephila clavipes]